MEPGLIDLEQLAKVRELEASFRGNGLLGEFDALSVFRERLDAALTQTVRDQPDVAVSSTSLSENWGRGPRRR